MYLRWSRRDSAQSIHARLLALSVSVVAIAGATGASAQTADDFAVGDLPPLEVETSPKKKVAKKRPTSEPQAAVTQVTSGTAAADTDAPVVFSANRTPTDLAKVGSSVSVVGEGQINAQGKIYLQDYLQQVPGVSISTAGGYGKTTSFRLRGFSQNYVKVLVDGMDISDPSGPQNAPAFENLLAGDVAQMEVLKGSQSTLYGGEAVAGVVSIYTKFADRPGIFHSGTAEYGTYNTWRGAYSSGYSDGRGSNVALTVQGINTDGFSSGRYGTEDDAYRNVTISGRGELKVSDNVTLFFAGRALEAHSEYDNSSGTDGFDATATSQHSGRVGAHFTFFNGQFVNTVAIQAMEVQRDLKSGSWFDGERVKGEYRGVISFNQYLAVVAGVDWERNGATTNSMSHKETDMTSPYAQVIVEPIHNLTLTAGARIDDHSAFGRFDTHRFTGAYFLEATGTKFHSSYGTGFRAPSLNELYGPWGANPNLTPETSEGWDAGVEQAFFNNRASLGVTYFEMDLTDRIAYTTGYNQVPGVTKTHGVEISGFAKLTERAVVNIAYTYTDSEEPDNTRITRLPRHNFVAGLTAQPIDKLSLNVTGQYVADSLDNNPWPTPGKGAVDDYFLLSAKVGYEVLPGAVAYVRGENLLDEDYVTIFGYNNPGMTVFGGLQFALPAN